MAEMMTSGTIHRTSAASTGSSEAVHEDGDLEQRVVGPEVEQHRSDRVLHRRLADARGNARSQRIGGPGRAHCGDGGHRCERTADPRQQRGPAVMAPDLEPAGRLPLQPPPRVDQQCAGHAGTEGDLRQRDIHGADAHPDEGEGEAEGDEHDNGLEQVVGGQQAHGERQHHDRQEQVEGRAHGFSPCCSS
jgi:hypothetical protein